MNYTEYNSIIHWAVIFGFIGAILEPASLILSLTFAILTSIVLIIDFTHYFYQEL